RGRLGGGSLNACSFAITSGDRSAHRRLSGYFWGADRPYSSSAERASSFSALRRAVRFALASAISFWRATFLVAVSAALLALALTRASAIRGSRRSASAFCGAEPETSRRCAFALRLLSSDSVISGIRSSRVAKKQYSNVTRCAVSRTSERLSLLCG